MELAPIDLPHIYAGGNSWFEWGVGWGQERGFSPILPLVDIAVDNLSTLYLYRDLVRWYSYDVIPIPVQCTEFYVALALQQYGLLDNELASQLLCPGRPYPWLGAYNFEKYCKKLVGPFVRRLSDWPNGELHVFLYDLPCTLKQLSAACRKFYPIYKGCDFHKVNHLMVDYFNQFLVTKLPYARC